MSVNLQKEAQDGARAERVIAETNEYFQMVRQGIFNTWAESPIEDIQGQHKLRLMLKLLEDVRGNIRTVAETGQMAKIQIQQEEKQKNFVRQTLNKLGVRV